jgi:hypothetical protein
VILLSATPRHKFEPKLDGVESIYEENGSIIIRMTKESNTPHVLFCAGGYGMFRDTVTGSAPRRMKARPPLGLTPKEPFGGKVKK